MLVPPLLDRDDQKGRHDSQEIYQQGSIRPSPPVKHLSAHRLHSGAPACDSKA